MSSLQQFFPVTLATRWLDIVPETLPDNLVNWLLDASSLTARLKARSQQFKVEVLGQAIVECAEHEACMAITQGDRVLAREVLLYCDGQAQVFARSLLPLSSLTGEQQQLAELGSQPLGQVLFNNPSLKRQSIQVAEFSPCSSVAKLAQQLALPTEHNLWGRRSLFKVEDKPIQVAEVFLPQSFAYQQQPIQPVKVEQ